jgi:glycosyltransferase involved in cell wall biosynthesis
MGRALISVIIPVYNCAQYLAAAIESVLAQTWTPREIIVIDDGSRDASAAVARSCGSSLTYAFQAHAGAGAARNHGVKLARGDYLAFLDADDLWRRDKLTLQMSALASRPDLQVVFGHVEQFVSPDLSHEQATSMDCPAAAAPARLPGTMLISSAAFRNIGWFCSDLRVGEFVEWYARAAELGVKDQIIPEVVLHRRIHATNSGILQREARSDYVRVIKAAIDRRKRAKEIAS